MGELILVTGGAGFIGGNFILDWFRESNIEGVVNLDLLTYASNLAKLTALQGDSRHTFIHGNIGDKKLVRKLLKDHHPRAIVNFAAETHVDRSIHGPAEFMKTNILGLFNLLECARAYWNELDKIKKTTFRFCHISTDEVYGSLSVNAPAFNEMSPYRPNSPYSASKAASDHLVRAWFHTYGLPAVTTNCSNNYGPHQYPEKLIPMVILNAIHNRPIPIYGDGQQVRDWLYVGDHCSAIREVLANGKVGETYNIGGQNEKTNIGVVNTICGILDRLKPRADHKSYLEQITFVDDRLGHDRRYAIDARKIKRALGWEPKVTFDSGIRKTVQWYLDNSS